MAEEKRTRKKKEESKPLSQRSVFLAVGGFVIVGLIGMFVLNQLQAFPSPLEEEGKMGGGAGETKSEVAKTPEEIQKVMKEAGKTKDASVCERIGPESRRKGCLDFVALSIALKKKDPTPCEKISEETKIESCKNNVYFSQAVSEKDGTICAEITAQEMKTKCEEAVTDLSQ